MYLFLDSINHDAGLKDILIYRFWPSGEKNIRLLNKLADESYHKNWFESKFNLPLICNDHEPLNFDYYSNYTVDDIKSTMIVRKNNAMADTIDFNQNVLDLIKNTNLAIGFKYFTIYDKFLLCHSELNSPQLKKYQDAGFIGVYWWSHALIARDWYRYAALDTQLDWNYQDIKYDFNVYSRAWSGSREYRLKILQLLDQAGIWDNCHIKLNLVDQDQSLDKFQPTAVSMNINECKKFFEINSSNISSSASADYDPADYRQCFFDLVLETIFLDNRIHLTEKILRPIALGKPFVVAAGPGSLETLRKYGFKTFEPYIDESYDSEVDPEKRMQMIVQTCQKISRYSEQQKKLLWEKIKPICQFNREYFFSDDFFDLVVKEYKDNLIDAYQQVNQHLTGYHWIEFRKALNLHEKSRYLNDRPVDELVEIFKTIHRARKK